MLKQTGIKGLNNIFYISILSKVLGQMIVEKIDRKKKDMYLRNFI